jgi:hypothetical protein
MEQVVRQSRPESKLLGIAIGSARNALPGHDAL